MQINQLSQLDQLSAGDLFAVFASSNGDTRAVSASALLAYIVEQLGSSAGMLTQYAQPNATGFSVQVAPVVDGQSVYLLLTPLAGYAAGTLVLPAQASCVDGQELLVSCTQAVTTLTVSGNGSSVNGAPTTLAANGFFRLRYDGVYKAWYRVS